MAVSISFKPLRLVPIVLLVLACGTAQAQRDDWHVQSGEIFIRSTFAHGYMHGYEQGFHNGDTDLQMGRDYRDVKTQLEYKKTSGFRPQYGDKSDFDDGYRKGFQVGYTDCFSGRNFRAVQLLKDGKAVFPSEKIVFDRGYDLAFRTGYETGQRQGLADGRNAASTGGLDPVECQVNTGHEAITPEYCAAYREGYQLGYSDGFANQRGTAAIFARNK
jgi:flagellar biosynthesis/type III secretory pathway protein FliH